MFRQIKSALIWYYLYRFRKRVALIVSLLALIFLSSYMYNDLVQYLKIRSKTEYLDILLPLKWIIILGAIFLIVYLILSSLRAPAQSQKRSETERDAFKETLDNKDTLSKKDIRKLAQELIEKKRLSKSKFNEIL